MKGIIYYFTGTGNNYILAKDLAAQIPGTEIRPMRLLPEDRAKLATCELIGFCVPSYYSHVPAAVKRYLEGVSFTPEQTIFTIIGCGSSRGVSTEELRERIEAGGGHVKNEYLVTCPGNFILSYGALPQIYERTVIRLSKKKIRTIAREVTSPDIQNRLGKALFCSEKQEPAIQKILATFPNRAAEYTVSDSCTGCGRCAAVCPVQNIRITENQPFFANNCQQCMACIQWCPQHAIDYKNISSKRKRYHHPEVTVHDLVKGAQI